MRISLILAGALTLAAVAFQIALAHGHFNFYAWASPYVWGVAGVVWMFWVVFAIRDSMRKRRMAPLAAALPTASEAPHETEPSSRPRSHGQPSLVFLGAKTVRIGFDAMEWRESFYESQKDVDPFGVVACFRSEPSPEMPGIDADRVRAQMIYRDKDGREMGIVPRACWLQDYSDMVDFPVGQSHCAILAILRPRGSLVAPRRRRATAPDGQHGQVITTEAYQFDERVSGIERRIMGESNQLLLPPLTFDFLVADGRPTTARRQ